MGARAWIVGRTADDRLMYGRSAKRATSGNGYTTERDTYIAHLPYHQRSAMLSSVDRPCVARPIII